MIFLLMVSACTPSSQTSLTFETETAQLPTNTPTETITPTITKTPFPTFTPQPTQNPFVFSSNLVSDFYTYDNFMAPFSAEDWENAEEMIDHRVYSFSTQYGFLNIGMDPAEFGNEEFSLRIPGKKLSPDINGIAIDIPAPLGDAPRTLAGIYVDLSDGNLHTSYDCGISYDLDGSFFRCNTNSPFRVLISIPVPIKESHHIHITWDQDEGLVFFFLNNHLVAYDDLYNHEPIYAESAGVHISRNFPYEGGIRRFFNLQLGTYIPNDYQLPDDLLPQLNQPVALESATSEKNLSV